MARFLHINIGFITNSSSCVYYFPRQLYEDPSIQAFMKAFEIDGGFIGQDLWHRGACATIAVTKEQKEEVRNLLVNNDYEATAPGINTEDDSIVIIYGDEYLSIASTLAGMLNQLAHRLGIQHISSDEYN